MAEKNPPPDVSSHVEHSNPATPKINQSGDPSCTVIRKPCAEEDSLIRARIVGSLFSDVNKAEEAAMRQMLVACTFNDIELMNMVREILQCKLFFPFFPIGFFSLALF